MTSSESSKEQSDWDASWTGLSGSSAEFYSLLKRRFAWPYEGFIINVARLLRRGAIDPERTKVLDFGCGQGRHAVFLARSGFEQVSGIDISDAAIQLARSWADHERLKIDYQSYAGKRLPYPDSTFGLVTCFGTFHHVPADQQQALAADLSRIIAPGGYLLLAEHSTRNVRLAPGPRIAKHSFIIDDPTNPEHGIVQHYLSLEQCRALFPAFRFRVGVTEFLEGEGLDDGSSVWNLCGTKKA